MKKDTLYKINLIINESGDITQATCGCPAGLGPCRTCKHVGALRYTLDKYTKISKLNLLLPALHTCKNGISLASAGLMYKVSMISNL